MFKIHFLDSLYSFLFLFSSRFLYLNKKKIKNCSGKTEQKASKDASNINLAPPCFTRKPSRRQIRRNFDSTHHEQSFETDNKRKFETKSISVPQPAYTYVKVILLQFFMNFSFYSTSFFVHSCSLMHFVVGSIFVKD